MKRIIFFITVLLCTQIASAQQVAYGRTYKTLSEIKADNMIASLGKKVSLTPGQNNELSEVISDYLDTVKELYGQENYAEKIAKLEAYRDNQAKKILQEDSLFTEYKICLNQILTQQRSGYGRR